MKKLTQTWRKQKAGKHPSTSQKEAVSSSLSSAQKEAASCDKEGGASTRRYLGRIQIDSKPVASRGKQPPLEASNEIKESDLCRDLSFGCSFGGEMDDNFLNAMEDIEKNYEKQKKSENERNVLADLDLNSSVIHSPKFVSTPSSASENRMRVNHNAPNQVRYDETEVRQDEGEVRYDSSSAPRGDSRLSSWGLPDVVLQRYSQKGISHLFPWQVECLRTGNALVRHHSHSQPDRFLVDLSIRSVTFPAAFALLHWLGAWIGDVIEKDRSPGCHQSGGECIVFRARDANGYTTTHDVISHSTNLTSKLSLTSEQHKHGSVGLWASDPVGLWACLFWGLCIDWSQGAYVRFVS
ncbi:hypothetical protein CAPTEDRAFT_226808 [Capitella teleta]|uniref:Uncharacterized protein n=1 Tax=Capitella teleta TaxID=283909 RepID=R7TSI6_CAPTE|nr:hypothetical protein CAPTEDRAFT_226808 [Capitella teleta]|eukprot:ELT96619.1 hypothetical protein CAPTEDRAFT_226808 [Capitella teleta]